MKKLLSVLLVAAMLLTGCLFLGSCSKVKAKDIEKDPTTAIGDAFDNTTSAFFVKDEAVSKVMEQVGKKGAFGISFESDAILPGMNLKVDETFYVENGEKFVSDTAVKLGDDEIAGRVYFDKNGYIVSGEDIFGDNTAYALNFDTLIAKLKDSFIASEMDEETINTLLDTFKQMSETLKEGAETREAEAKELANEIYALLKQNVSDEKEKNDDGKNTKYTVATYTINNETVKAVLNKIIDAAASEMSAEDVKEAKEEINESFEDITIDMSAKIYIARKTNLVEKINLAGKVIAPDVEYNDRGEYVETTQEVTLDATLKFTAEEISIALSGKADGEDISASVKLTKEEKDGGVTYNLTADATMATEGGVTANVNLLKLSIARAQDGAISISADIMQDEDTRMKIDVNGKLEVTDKKVALTLNELKLDGESPFAFTLTLSAEIVDSIPAAPSDATDVMDMTEQQWMDFAEKIMNSELGKLIEKFD